MARVFKCPHCSQTIGVPPYGMHFDCPHCAETIYFSHCWKCYTPISGSRENRCPACGWHYCDNCTACSPDCGEKTADDKAAGTSAATARADEIRELFRSDPEDPDCYDDFDTADLVGRMPEAYWEDWFEEEAVYYDD